jgi:CheY-like chemotaxis protein
VATVLIIDDDDLVRRAWRIVLSRDGHTVHEAADGGAGLRAVEAVAPDVVVCDLFMPGAEGIETIRAVRRRTPAVPVVAVSGGGRWGLLDALCGAAELGAVVALPKPVSFALLRRVVGDLAAGRPVPADPCPSVPEAASRHRLCPWVALCTDAGTSVRCGAVGRTRPPLHPLPVVGGVETEPPLPGG